MLATLLHNEHRTISIPEIEYENLIYQGNAYFNEKQFRLAVKSFEDALIFRKGKNRYKTHVGSSDNMFNEEEVRYKLALAYKQLGEQNSAIITLQALPHKLRTTKINMLLAKLLHYGRHANSTEAIAAYKEVLKDNCLAMEAIDGLLLLGVDGIEVNNLVNGEFPFIIE